MVDLQLSSRTQVPSLSRVAHPVQVMWTHHMPRLTGYYFRNHFCFGVLFFGIN